jgi:hypothetical protein
MISVHDNVTTGYEVKAAGKSIVIHTEFPFSTPKEMADIVFSGVIAYHFRHDLFNNIIMDVHEIPMVPFLEENEQMFDEGCQWGWPVGWNKRKEDFRTFLDRHAAKVFQFEASYGMSGWVIAESMITQRPT